jgi:hypothetical protein
MNAECVPAGTTTTPSAAAAISHREGRSRNRPSGYASTAPRSSGRCSSAACPSTSPAIHARAQAPVTTAYRRDRPQATSATTTRQAAAASSSQPVTP